MFCVIGINVAVDVGDGDAVPARTAGLTVTEAVGDCCSPELSTHPTKKANTKLMARMVPKFLNDMLPHSTLKVSLQLKEY